MLDLDSSSIDIFSVSYFYQKILSFKQICRQHAQTWLTSPHRFQSQTWYSFMIWSILDRHTGQPHFFDFTSFKQDIHPATWPQGMHAPSAGASKHITHDEPLPLTLVPSPLESFSTSEDAISTGLKSIDGYWMGPSVGISPANGGADGLKSKPLAFTWLWWCWLLPPVLACCTNSLSLVFEFGVPRKLWFPVFTALFEELASEFGCVSGKDGLSCMADWRDALMAIANPVSSAAGGAVGGPVGTLFCKNPGFAWKIRRIMHHAMSKEDMYQNSKLICKLSWTFLELQMN